MRHSHGSAKRLFLIVYIVGTIVTVLLSNDATAVVLTPAVYAATRAAKVEPLPYLFICAFIANAASFVLPISNPANLVVFGTQMPPLSEWLHTFALPSVVAIVVTYVVLRLTQRRELEAAVAAVGDIAPLRCGGQLAALGIAMTAVVLLAASALGSDLGLPTFVAGATVTALVLLIARQSPLPVLRDISWSVLPLVAGLFILVEGLNRTGVLPALARRPEAGLDRLAAAHLLDRRHRRRHRIEPCEQSADGFDRGDHQSNRAGSDPCHRCDPDRRRSRS